MSWKTFLLLCTQYHMTHQQSHLTLSWNRLYVHELVRLEQGSNQLINENNLLLYSNILYDFQYIHFAVVRSVIEALMTSQRGKNKNVVTDVLNMLWRPLCIYNWIDNDKMESICFIHKKHDKIHFKRVTEFSWGIFGVLKKMNRVSWRDPWSIKIKQRHWLVIFHWDSWLVCINRTTLVT